MASAAGVGLPPVRHDDPEPELGVRCPRYDYRCDERQREIEAGRTDRPADRTLAELAEEYLTYKQQQGKRSLREDRRIVKTRLLPALGSDQPVRRLTAPAIAQYEKRRAAKVSAFTGANELGIMRGASLKDVQEFLGHADLKMTQRYAHLSPAHLRTAVDRLDGLASAPRAREWAQSGKLSGATPSERRATSGSSSRAPVAQVDRAAVS